ncbi:MAG: serine/threonine-protein kinase [Gemmataceae bacterium]
MAMALQLSGDERETYLHRACAGQPDLLAQVRKLLHERAQSRSTFEGDPMRQVVTQEFTTDQVGPYRLLQILGEGGMGVVYLAEQSEPVQRRVALKIIKPGLDSRQIITRFEAERQALALMDHPHIARVLDAGTTQTGRPFFVMELVHGLALTTYADHHGLDIRARLELFIPVCLAIQHAHSKGVIHRDIKPSNVLVAEVDGRPVPKVIDFGLAKALEARLTDHSLHTQMGVVIGTPEYMSPEQAALTGQDVDTRSDVYSLGVMLFQLLTGSTPMSRTDSATGGMMELLRRITLDDPERPSLRLERMDRDRLARQVRGELDWITLKALEKNPARRYQTAIDLADDLQRYLQGEAVEAVPPTTWYRAWKFAARHRVALTTALAALILLLAATAISVHLAIVAEGERRRATTEARVAREALDFLREDLLGQPGPDLQTRPWIATRRNPTLVDALNRATDRLHGRFHDSPRVEIAIRNMLGNAYRELGQLTRAEEQLEQARALALETLGERHPDTLRTTYNLGWVYGRQARFGDQLDLIERLATLTEQTLGPHDRLTLSTRRELGWVLVEVGQYDKAEALLKPTLAALREALGPFDEETLDCMESLAFCYIYMGNYPEAAERLTEVQKLAEQLGPDGALFRLSIRLDRAFLAACENQYGEADRLSQGVVEEGKQFFDPAHPEAREALLDRAWILDRAGRRDEAGALFKRLYETGRASGEAPGRWAAVLQRYGSFLVGIGREREAEGVLREALPIYEKLYPDSWRLDLLRSDLGGSLLAQKRYAEAEPFLRAAWTGLSAKAARVPAFEKANLAEAERRLSVLERSRQ